MEVRDRYTDISRIQAKKNLNTVIESNTRTKNNSMVFDKYWYQKRIAYRTKTSVDVMSLDGRGMVTKAEQ